MQAMNAVDDLRGQGRMTWLEAERGWVAAPEDIVRALSTDGFQECKRETTTSRRDSRPAGGLWQGINIRTGAVASAIWVNGLLSRQAMVFITVDGQLFQGDVSEEEGKRMTPNPPEILRDRGRSLEDEFFRREDKRLMEQLAALRAAEVTREALGKASGISNPAVLDQLLELGIRAETVAALTIVPLVEVAWADGTIDAKERRAILERAGVPQDSTAGALLAAWLDRRPQPDLLAAWTHLVRAMSEHLGPEEAERLKAGLLERARAVAAAAGGIFGVGSKISSAEAAMLAKLEATFPSRR